MLERLNIEFTCESPNIDEQQKDSENIEDYVLRLAEEKAVHIGLKHENTIIIGSDQALECAGNILSKPGNHENAIKQLSSMSGKSLIFYTGLCVINTVTKEIQKDVIPFRVNFRELSEEEIEDYLQKEPCIQRAYWPSAVY